VVPDSRLSGFSFGKNMLDLLAKKCTTGEVSLSLAEHYLAAHEWGLAKRAIDEAMSRGGLVNMDHAIGLLGDICQRMGVKAESHSRKNPSSRCSELDS
jgi:hypothetical protein